MIFGGFFVCSGIEQTTLKLLISVQPFDFYFYFLFIEIGMNTEKLISFISRHDWYQTESHVVVTVMAKNISKDGVCASFTEKEV